MYTKDLALHPEQEKAYQRQLVNQICRHLFEQCSDHGAELYLTKLLGRYGQPGLESIFPKEVITWIKYLLSHRQLLFWYRKNKSF